MELASCFTKSMYSYSWWDQIDSWFLLRNPCLIRVQLSGIAGTKSGNDLQHCIDQTQGYNACNYSMQDLKAGRREGSEIKVILHHIARWMHFFATWATWHLISKKIKKVLSLCLTQGQPVPHEFYLNSFITYIRSKMHLKEISAWYKYT